MATSRWFRGIGRRARGVLTVAALGAGTLVPGCTTESGSPSEGAPEATSERTSPGGAASAASSRLDACPSSSEVSGGDCLVGSYEGTTPAGRLAASVSGRAGRTTS